MNDHNTNNTKMKVCSKCKWELPANTTYFNVCNRVKSGLSAQCKQCRLEYRLVTKDKKREYDRKYRKRNKERLDNYFEQWKEDNRDLYLEGKRRYNQANRERQKKWHKSWVKRNPERYAELARNSVQRRLARKRNLPYDYNVDDWEETVSFFDSSCAYCGVKSSKLERDHFIPISKGGEYTIDNIVPSCRKCNRNKSNNDFFDWYINYEYYSKERKNKVLKFLGYCENNTQQLTLV